MRKSPIRLDRSSTSVVVVCALCPWWQAFRWTTVEAWAVAVRHEVEQHPDLTHQRDAARQRALYEERHAVHS